MNKDFVLLVWREGSIYDTLARQGCVGTESCESKKPDSPYASVRGVFTRRPVADRLSDPDVAVHGRKNAWS